MTWPSFVADGAVAAIGTAADAIGTPAAETMRGNARELVADPKALAAAMKSAVAQVAGTGNLETLAANGAKLPAVTRLTVNREREDDNRKAIDRLVMLTAALELADRLAARSFADRRAAVAALTAVTGALDELAGDADDGAFRTMEAVKAASTAHVTALQADLPRVVTVEPGGVAPSLVVAYAAYGDIARADEVAERNALPRPGFVPAGPIELAL